MYRQVAAGSSTYIYMHTVATNTTQEHTNTQRGGMGTSGMGEHKPALHEGAWGNVCRWKGVQVQWGALLAKHRSIIQTTQQARQRLQDNTATSTAKRRPAGVSNSCCTPCFQLRPTSVPSTLLLWGHTTRTQILTRIRQ